MAPMVVPIPARPPRRADRVAGAVPRRRPRPDGPVPRLARRDLRALYGPGPELGVPRLARCRRKRFRLHGLAAETRDRLAGRRGVPRRGAGGQAWRAARLEIRDLPG